MAVEKKMFYAGFISLPAKGQRGRFHVVREIHLILIFLVFEIGGVHHRRLQTKTCGQRGADLTSMMCRMIEHVKEDVRQHHPLRLTRTPFVFELLREFPIKKDFDLRRR